ncbi:MAG TPA: nickel pincer cofactor biosynthesis protein LarC [Candidatus Wallbacteria bacterium]|nr:nickel pincer cofactor biosynthesis protein LarC [Candidatus Wallbacteria bacterium]
MKVLFFDCFSGISGDMTIGAFLDAGVDYDYLKNELAKLKLEGYSLKAEKTTKNGLAATKFNVMDCSGNVFGHAPLFSHCHKTHGHGVIEGVSHNGAVYRDHIETHAHIAHDHQHAHDHNHVHGHDHDHGHDHGHDHDHAHELEQEGAENSCEYGTPIEHHEHEILRHEANHSHLAAADHSHRNLEDIKKIINSSKLNKNVREISIKIFENIAAAESKMHNVAVDKIHFHEVGAIDSIIDIVGTAICVDFLKIEKFYVSKIPVSFSFIKTAHGKWPNPAPASLELLKNFTLTKSPVEKELVTPTGAAIIKTLCEPCAGPPDFELKATGYGAGYHDFEHPNVLRIMIGEKKKIKTSVPDAGICGETAAALGCETDEVDILTANIDDMQPEYFEHLVEELMGAGALDVSLGQILMKKGRPAFELSVMSETSLTAKISEIIFRLTSTIGLRVERVSRLVLKREKVLCELSAGKSVPIKVSYLKGEICRVKPEYEELKKFAAENKIGIDEARDLILTEFKKTFSLKRR